MPRALVVLALALVAGAFGQSLAEVEQEALAHLASAVR
jgi:hypothetical protein